MSDTVYTTEMPAIRGHNITADGDKSDIVTLLEHWTVKGKLDDGRVFVISIKEGFEFDGASIPRALWRVCGHPMECPRLAAALAHDWLYQAHVCSRETADKIYRAISKQVGINGFCAGVEYYTLRWFGGSAWDGWKFSANQNARHLGRIRWR